MNFGQNLYNWFLSNAQSLVLLAIVVIGLYLGFKREFFQTYRFSGGVPCSSWSGLQCGRCKGHLTGTVQ